MSDTYLIPQFVIDYLQKSRSTKNPQKLAPRLTKTNLTPEIENWFKENKVNARYIWKFFVFYGLNKFSFRECPVCGKRVSIKTILSKPNTKYCSIKCARISDEFKEQFKQTCLEKYGVEHPAHSKEVREKIKQTSLKKYGVEHPLQAKKVRDKMKQTNSIKYGVTYSFQAKEIKEKAKKTFLKRYGITNPSQSKEVREKSFQTRRSNYWETFCSLLKERDIIPLFTKEEYINDTGRNFNCLVCDETFKSEGTYKNPLA